MPRRPFKKSPATKEAATQCSAGWERKKWTEERERGYEQAQREFAEAGMNMEEKMNALDIREKAIKEKQEVVAKRERELAAATKKASAVVEMKAAAAAEKRAAETAAKRPLALGNTKISGATGDRAEVARKNKALAAATTKDLAASRKRSATKAEQREASEMIENDPDLFFETVSTRGPTKGQMLELQRHLGDITEARVHNFVRDRQHNPSHSRKQRENMKTLAAFLGPDAPFESSEDAVKSLEDLLRDARNSDPPASQVTMHCNHRSRQYSVTILPMASWGKGRALGGDVLKEAVSSSSASPFSRDLIDLQD